MITRLKFNDRQEMKEWLDVNNNDTPKFINWILFTIAFEAE